jgi:hypothetical protein
LVEENGGPGENIRPVASHWQILSHNVVHFALIKIRTHNSSCDCIGSCKSSYHTIKKTERTIKNGQCRDTVNIRHKTLNEDKENKKTQHRNI